MEETLDGVIILNKPSSIFIAITDGVVITDGAVTMVMVDGAVITAQGTIAHIGDHPSMDGVGIALTGVMATTVVFTVLITDIAHTTVTTITHITDLITPEVMLIQILEEATTEEQVQRSTDMKEPQPVLRIGILEHLEDIQDLQPKMAIVEGNKGLQPEEAGTQTLHELG